MKAKTIKRIACVLSAAILVTSVSYYGPKDEPVVVQAEETLFGIQKIKSNQLTQGGTYTILELVPDIAAAEIGYMVPGMEPAISSWDANTGEWTNWQKELGNYQTEDERRAYVEQLKGKLDTFLTTYGFTDADGNSIGNAPVWYETYQESAVPVEGYERLPIASTTVKGYFNYIGEGEGFDLTFLPHKEFDDMTGNEFDVTGHYYYGVGTAITNENYVQLTDDDKLYVLDNYGVNYVYQGTWGELKDTLLMVEPEAPENNENPLTVTDGDANYLSSVTAGDAQSTETPVADIENTENSAAATQSAESSAADAVSDGDDSVAEDIEDENFAAPGDIILNPDLQTYYLAHFTTLTPELATTNDPELKLDPKTMIYTVDLDNIISSATGEYALIENEAGYEFVFATNSVYYTGGFVNGEWFREKVLNMEPAEADTFRVKVVTMTYEQFNARVVDASSTLPAYDLLYLNSGSRGVNVTNRLDTQDLTQYAMRRLFLDLLDAEKPCLLDASILYETAADGTIQPRNAYKTKYLYYMCTMLSQERPASCYDEVNGTKTVDEWLSTVKADADKNFVAENIYSFYGSLINPAFLTNTIYSPEMAAVQEGFQDVLDEIETENYYRETDSTGEYQDRLVANNISQATAVRHVINYVYRRNSKVKDHIRVLEIQPARVYRGTEDAEELNEEIVRSWIPDGDRVETVEITTMTTAEFIGKIEDINAEYDLIYIGTETDFMNVNEWGQTVYNDPNMKHLIYFHTGDKRYSTMELSGMLDTDYVNPNNKANSNVYAYTSVRYSGNDITEEKREALDAFLNASYPIVLSDKFFDYPVTIFTDINYGDRVTDRSPAGMAHLGVGEYDMDPLRNNYGMGNDDVTSLKVSKGYEVTFYENNNFGGASVSFTEDTAWVGNAYNDWMTSMSVKRIDGVETERTVNEYYIDNSSYIYQFVRDAAGKDNLFSVSDLAGGSEAFNFYLNRPKVDFTNIQVNGSEYTKENDHRIYEIQPNGKKYTLEYDFTITNEGASSINTTYTCELFIDVNADGKYSDSEEIGDITITWNGQEVPVDQLYADRNYKLTRVLPDGYKGVLPWKIQLSQNNNAYVHNAITGYTKLMNQPVEVINVLQICRPTIAYPDWWGGTGEVLFDLSKQVATEGNVYHALIQGGTYNGITYPGIGNDYIINFEFLTTDDYEREYKEYMNAHPGQDSTSFFKYGFEDDDDTTDKSIDMLILGFSDAYDDISGDPLQGVVDFIGSGKSVLFAHDTMMYWNHSKYKSDGAQRLGISNRIGNTGDPSDQYYCSYDLGQKIRSLVGMDRYGVMNNQYLKAGTGFGTGNAEAWASLDESKDKAYTPRSAGTSVVRETQGYTYSIINAKYGGDQLHNRTFSENEIGEGTFTNTYTNLKYPQVVYYSEGNDPNFNYIPRTNNYDNGELPANYNGEVTNLVVTKTNSGQITDYPYKLDDQFQVSKTHGQYYQLDFTADDDNDGQSDLVVWFCLGGRYKNSNTNQYQETIYSASPNDVANNYYIYNKGNVTYTGVGHSGTGELHTLDEAKLFVNTMIAAYRAGITDPSISCLSNGLPGASEIKATYSFYDEQNDISMVPGGDTDSLFEKVYFKATDYNVVSGTRYINVNCYYPATGAGSVEISTGGNTVSVKKMTDLDLKAYYQGKGITLTGVTDAELARNKSIYDADTNNVVANGSLESGEIYYVLVPKVFIQDNMNNDGMFNIYMEAQSTITRPNLTDPNKPYIEQTSKVYTEFSFTRVNLFELE